MEEAMQKNAPQDTSSNPSDSAASAARPAPAPARATNTPKPNLTEKDLERLHLAFEETGNRRLGQVLDRLCDDPDCEFREED